RAAGGGATQAAGDAGSQFVGGFAAERQNQDAVRVHAPGFDAFDDSFDNGGGFAGAGAGQYQERSAGVIEDSLLLRVQDRALGGLGPLNDIGSGHGHHLSRRH